MSDTINAISKNMSQDIQSLNTISQNVANISTPSYKAQRISPSFNQTLQKLEFNPVMDLREGPIVQTGRELDIAITGKGFFRIEQDNQIILARSGSFKVDSQGRLVTDFGGLVMSDTGPIYLNQGKVKIYSNGDIWQSDQQIGKLNIVNVMDVSQLRSTAGGYLYKGELVEETGSLLQGALEQSNVNAADETIKLMELSRHIESIQRAISTYDKVLDIGINQIGDK